MFCNILILLRFSGGRMRQTLSSFFIVTTSFILMTCGGGGGAGGPSGPGNVASTTSGLPAGSSAATGLITPFSSVPTKADILAFLRAQEWMTQATDQERQSLYSLHPNYFHDTTRGVDPLEQIISIVKFNNASDDGSIKYFGFDQYALRGADLETATPLLTVEFDIHTVAIDAVTGIVSLELQYKTQPFNGLYVMRLKDFEADSTPGFTEINSFGEEVQYSTVVQELFSAELAMAGAEWRTDAIAAGLSYWKSQGVDYTSTGIAEVVKFDVDSQNRLLSRGSFLYYGKDSQGNLLPDPFFTVQFDVELWDTSLLHNSSGNPVGYVHDLRIAFKNSLSPTGQVRTTWNGNTQELLDLKVTSLSASSNPAWEMVTVNGATYTYTRK